MRIAVMGDVGQPVYHVGDEAMTHAVAHELTARGHTPVLLTRDVAHTRHHFGPDVKSALTLRFPWAPEDRHRYLREIQAVLAGHTAALPRHDQIFDFIETIRSVDALVIAGGGNMNSRYGWLLFERLAALAVARHLGKPTFVTGQTLGPAISEPDAAAAREALAGVLGFAARERATLALAPTLAPEERVHAVLDDASFLADIPVPAGWAPAAEVVPGAIVVTLAPGSLGQGDALLGLVAETIDLLAERTGAPVHLVPHMATPGAGDGDEEMHQRLAAAMRTPAVSLPIEHALVAARRAREASVIVTSRYHPAVFAWEGGASVLGIAPDAYTRTRLGGAGENWGQLDAVLIDCVQSTQPSATELADAVLASADTTRAAAAERGPELRVGAAAFWDALVSGLRCQTAPPASALPEFDRLPPRLPRAASEGAFEGGPEGAAESAAPAVSVIVRTKDRPFFLARALDDITAQGFDDFEVIVVNDAGDPAPVDAAVAARGALTGRVQVIHRAESTGMEAASNAGLAAARGEFVVIHDDDDTWDPTFLSQTVGYLRSHPDEDAVASRIETVWERVPEGAAVALVEERVPLEAHLEEITISDQLHYNRLVPIGLLYRRSVHDQIGPYDERLPVVGDWEFTMRLARRGIIHIVGGEPLAFWHRRRDVTEAAHANSVHAQRQALGSFDRKVRDERLREHLDREGDGALLYLTWFMGHRYDSLERRLDEVSAKLDRLLAATGETEQHLSQRLDAVSRDAREAGLAGALRRKLRAVRSRLPRPRA